MDDRCLLFFVKNPDQGTVKSRLAASVGEQVARELYRNFILDMLSTIETHGFPLYICFHPADALGELKRLAGEHQRFLPQQGDDLGERMQGAFLHVFAMQCNRVVLVGSDIPDLPADIIAEAFAFLEAVECVLGPSSDGGYYLIGFNRQGFLHSVFTGLPWGTPVILTRTLSILKQHRRTVHLLPRRSDIDTVEDLQIFLSRSRHRSRAARTVEYLRRITLPVAGNQH
jgi:hypothetical protein